ncbi:hypothetical protein Taro_053806 [Colocasia esculenta]|uniref:Retrotransposon gag domain-containing protein n=1 Tax=Colocasia esculenta TaxID=4460 RepID=A0A843XLX8_COLES|nr:hypothetical protein [Colocasia esculenta]
MADMTDWGGGGDEPEETTHQMIERIWESLIEIRTRLDHQTPVQLAVEVPPIVEKAVPVAPPPPPPLVEVPPVVPILPAVPAWVASVEDPTALGEKFLRLQLPAYSGGLNPNTAEHWVHEVERVFVIIRCPQANRVVLATYQLHGFAQQWWRLKMQTAFAGRTEDTITWPEFLEIQQAKREQLRTLQQGNLTVLEYQMRFMVLSRYAPYVVTDNIMMVEYFIRGLRSELQDAWKKHRRGQRFWKGLCRLDSLEEQGHVVFGLRSSPQGRGVRPAPKESQQSTAGQPVAFSSFRLWRCVEVAEAAGWPMEAAGGMVPGGWCEAGSHTADAAMEGVAMGVRHGAVQLRWRPAQWCVHSRSGSGLWRFGAGRTMAVRGVRRRPYGVQSWATKAWPCEAQLRAAVQSWCAADQARAWRFGPDSGRLELWMAMGAAD